MKELEKVVEDLERTLENIDINKRLEDEGIKELEKVAIEIDIDKALNDINTI